MMPMTTGVGRGGVVAGEAPATAGCRALVEELTLPIALAERVRKTLAEESSPDHSPESLRHADSLLQMLRSAARLATTPTLYDRPLRRVAAEVAKSLDRVLAVLRRHRHRQTLLRRLLSLTNPSTDLRKALSLLDNSVADMTWLLSLYSSATGATSGITLTLPPIASTDPILAWVWSYVAVVQMGSSSYSDRAEAATALSNLALDNDRNKNLIMEQGGIPPLLSLLKDAAATVDVQIAAAAALAALAAGRDVVSSIISEHGAVHLIVQVLSDSPTKLQTIVATLVEKMAEKDSNARDEFARENAIRPLVTLLSSDIPLDEPPKPALHKPTSIHSLVKINFDNHHNQQQPGNMSTTWSRKERDFGSPEAKLQLKTACAAALRMLCRGSIANSHKITETKGLLCLSKIIEREEGELQQNCLLTVMEITTAAESDANLRRSAFKMNSPAAKSVVDQLLRVVQEGDSPMLQIPAIKSIGLLARTFPARETRVISPLVVQLTHWSSEVAIESAIALGKFSCPDNFLCVEHSKAIIEFDGVPLVVRLIRLNEKAQLHGLILLCYLALHVSDNEALKRARASTVIHNASHSAVAQHPSLRELIPKALRQINLYHDGTHSPTQSYVP